MFSREIAYMNSRGAKRMHIRKKTLQQRTKKKPRKGHLEKRESEPGLCMVFENIPTPFYVLCNPYK